MPVSPEITYEPSSHPALPVQPPTFEACFSRIEHTTSEAIHPMWEKQYGRTGIGAVLSGEFDYRTQTGSATGLPGTVFFGNEGDHFGVRYLNSNDVRRLVVWYDNEFIENVAQAHGLDDPRFRLTVLPPGKVALSILANLTALLKGCGNREDTAFALAATALTIGLNHRVTNGISSRDRDRMLSIVKYIERSFSEECTIETLANSSGLSRYHFMRLFKAVTGQSVNQYVINTRLRAALACIAETKAPVSEIALDVGFNDISHFNTCFRSMFNCTPRQMRRQIRAA